MRRRRGLRKFITLRDATPRRPGSTAPIDGIDHPTPHTDGGETTTANSQGLSKRDHHLRDLPGWQIKGDGNATITWTTPTSHQYKSRPPPILDPDNTKPPPPPDDHDEQ